MTNTWHDRFNHRLEKARKQMATFMIIDQLSVYGVIVEMHALNSFQAFSLTCNMMMKFTTPTRVKVVKGDQIEAR